MPRDSSLSKVPLYEGVVAGYESPACTVARAAMERARGGAGWRRGAAAHRGRRAVAHSGFAISRRGRLMLTRRLRPVSRRRRVPWPAAASSTQAPPIALLNGACNLHRRDAALDARVERRVSTVEIACAIQEGYRRRLRAGSRRRPGHTAAAAHRTEPPREHQSPTTRDREPGVRDGAPTAVCRCSAPPPRSSARPLHRRTRDRARGRLVACDYPFV